MKKFIQVVPLALAVLATVVFPSISFAATGPIHSDVWNPATLAGPLVICTGDGSNGTSACSDLCDLIAQIANVLYFTIAVVIWILTPIFVAWAGIEFMLSRGSSERTGHARKMITGLVVGLLICLCSYLIISTFVSFVGIAGIGGFSNPTCAFSS